MLNFETHLNMLNSPVRRIQAGVELYEGSTLVDTYKYTDSLLEFTIERVGQGKFFGFGFVHKANIKLIDVAREKNISTANNFKVLFGVNNEYEKFYPNLYVTEVNRDEKTNELSITAYDKLRQAEKHIVEEVGLHDGLSIKQIALYCATMCGIGAIELVNVNDGVFDTEYSLQQLNISGQETIRQMLDAVAEATQTIYYLNRNNTIVFRRLDRDGAADFTINRAKYIDLECKTNRRLKKVVSVTELGDNLHVEMAANGSTQYVRENPFWTLRTDLADLMAPIMDSVINMCINQFECEWRGNYLLEPGDKLYLIGKDGSVVSTYLLDDTIEYNGGLEEKTSWKYEDNENETESTPSTIGEAINQTIAKVDKVNKEITLMIEDVEEMDRKVTSIQMTSENIQATVEAQSSELGALSKRVEATMSADDIRLEIQESLKDVNEVTTTTGYTFNKDGLMVTKDGSEMKTQVSEDGMTVYRKNEVVLRADNEGVKAEDLHATTYLLIGTNSRLENYRGVRTGCFWIGEERT